MSSLAWENAARIAMAAASARMAVTGTGQQPRRPQKRRQAKAIVKAGYKKPPASLVLGGVEWSGEQRKERQSGGDQKLRLHRYI